MNITKIVFGSASTISCSTLAIVNPNTVIKTSSSTDLLTSIAILITNEYISKIRNLYTKVRDSDNVITLVYAKILMQSMIQNKIDEKEAPELKKIYNLCLDKISDIMKKTQFKVEDVFGNIIGKETFNQN